MLEEHNISIPRTTLLHQLEAVLHVVPTGNMGAILVQIRESPGTGAVKTELTMPNTCRGSTNFTRLCDPSVITGSSLN